MIQVTLRLTVPNMWFTDIAKKYGATINVLECNVRTGHEDGCSELVEILDIEERTEEVLEDLRNHPNIVAVEDAPSRKGSMIAAIKTNHCGVCSLVHDIDAFKTHQSTNKDGKVEWKLIATDEKVLLNLITTLKSRGIEVQLVSKVHVDMDSLLTARQEKIVQVAYKRGYFDYPKRINIRELARIFEVSISTMSEILRKSEKKIIGKYFKDV
jgi:predicted DNA binding protein